MNKFKTVIWYLGVLIIFLLLVLSFLTKNWLLTGVCALVTAILKAKNAEVAIPRFYREKGISNAHFSDGGKNEKTVK